MRCRQIGMGAWRDVGFGEDVEGGDVEFECVIVVVGVVGGVR